MSSSPSPSDPGPHPPEDEGFVEVPAPEAPKVPSAPRRPPGAPSSSPSSPPSGTSVPGDDLEGASDRGYVEVGTAVRPSRSYWLGNPTAERRRAHMIAAVGLVLAALTVAVGVGSSTEYRAISLEAAGSFFSLAIAGQVLYASSFDGGAVLLERSTDMGVSWAPVAVPYLATIAPGGADWNYAVVALDGSNLIMVAATGATDPSHGGSPPACGATSTLLLAYSPNSGATWTSANETTLSGSVSWMNAAVVGDSAGVAWVSTAPDCGGVTPPEQVLARTSSDGGAIWGSVENLSLPSSDLPDDGHLEMTAGNDGIVVGFVEQATSQGLPLLSLYRFIAGETPDFVLYGDLSVDSTWTLQGEPSTPAFLLTPSYLVPLGNPPLTAIPFGELQADGGGLAELPAVTSLVDLGGGVVEVAAAMPQGGGVDCWQIDEGTDQVTQSCHVPLSSFFQPSSFTPPVIALLDGGGWWLAIGVAPGPTQSSGCTTDCPATGSVVHPWNDTSPPPQAGSAPASGADGLSATGVSICWVGCASAGGIVAYYFSQAPPVDISTLDALAAALFLAGGLWFLGARRARPTGGRPPATPLPGPVEETLLPPRATRRESERLYRVGLAIWALLWLPVVVTFLVPGGAAMDGWTPLVLVVCGLVGAALAVPYHGQLRRSLQEAHGVLPGNVLGFDRDPEPKGFAYEPVRRAARHAYVSWFAGCAAVVVALPFLLGDATLSSATTFDTVQATTGLGAGGYLLAALVLLFVLFRMRYHESIAEAAALVRTRSSPPTLKTRMAGSLGARTRWGARLLALNPLAGLLLGWAIQPALPQGPYVLPGAFLVATLAGIALLGGAFGTSVWAPSASEVAGPSQRAVLA